MSAVSINERYSILTFLDVGAADVEAFDMYRHLTCVGLLLLLAGCHKPQPLRAAHATHANEPPDIAWFDGSLEGAFIVATKPTTCKFCVMTQHS